MTEKFPFDEGPDKLAFLWPTGQTPADFVAPQPYAIEISLDSAAFEAVQAAVGWPLTAAQW